MIVVDTNVLAARCLYSTSTHLAKAVEQKDAVWITPYLWRYEFQNILAKAIWSEMLELPDAIKAWHIAVTQIKANERDPSPENVMKLVESSRITAYDATFVALAQELSIPCITEDKELCRKFPTFALRMEDYINKIW